MIVLDIETTGLDPKRHSIIEVGAMEFDDPQNVFNEKCRIWPGAEIDQGALEINGFSIHEITAPAIQSQRELLTKFNDWISSIADKTIAGQNVDFDIGFLNESCKRLDLSCNVGKRKVDLHSLVYAHLLGRKIKPPLKDGSSGLSSDLIMNYVGIPAEPRPHKALNGARYETEALSRLIHGKSVFEEFSGYAIPVYLKSNQL
jgi:DNA polymerase III epsilon subunit-like protein